MEVKLLHHAPISLLIGAIRTCWESHDKSDSYENDIGTYCIGPVDRKLINHVIKNGHTSTLEHLTFCFDIKGFSRDVLQEFSRHRIGVSPSVKSTRYTLQELKEVSEPFVKTTKEGGVFYNLNLFEHYCVVTDTVDVNIINMHTLESIRKLIQSENRPPNDKLKYCLPGAYKTAGRYTFNARALRQLFKLRTAPDALWEFRILAYALYEALPEEYKFLFQDVVYQK